MNRLLSVFLILCAFAAPAESANQKPIAQAGPDQTVGLSVAVTLRGDQSSDSDGRIKKYIWRQTQGPKLKLTGAKTARASFTSPAKPTPLSFKLTVTDNKGATASDTVAITVMAPPTCILPQVLQNNGCVTPPPVCVAPQILGNGVCVTPPPVCVAPQVLQSGVCVTPPTPTPSCAPPQVPKSGVCVTPPANLSFNDTGITLCGDALFNVACPLAGLPGQDAQYGRDALLGEDSDGHAGFSFTKIGPAGEELPTSASQWACVRDNVTGLMWEVKTDDGGLRDKDALYTNYSASHNPGGKSGSATDAEGFAKAVNADGLCGAKDWRVPTVDELQGLLDYSHPLPGPAIDAAFFPNTANTLHWTATPHARSAVRGWGVYLDDGRVFDDEDRDRPSAVQLVRTAILQIKMSLAILGTTASGPYIISVDGQEVTDTRTQLVWRRCVEGMAWNGATCAGPALFGMWDHALHRADAEAHRTGQAWRLPNVKELAGLVDRASTELTPDVLAIDPTVFPATPNFQAWSSSPSASDAFYAWSVHFYYGSVYFTYLEDNGAIRLVRDGP
ncbi:Lcl domain-containing protein [Methylomagnum sp.]